MIDSHLIDSNVVVFFAVLCGSIVYILLEHFLYRTKISLLEKKVEILEIKEKDHGLEREVCTALLDLIEKVSKGQVVPSQDGEVKL